MEKLYSVIGAAECLGVSKFTIYKWLSQSKLRRTKAGGRTLVRESEIVKLLEDGAPARKSHRAANAALTATDEAVAGGK
jgi:excisionase family DNA binding protein